MAIDGRVSLLCPLGGVDRPHKPPSLAPHCDAARLLSEGSFCHSSVAHELSPISDVSLGSSGRELQITPVAPIRYIPSHSQDDVFYLFLQTRKINPTLYTYWVLPLVIKKERVMMLLSCSLWYHDVSFPPSFDMVLHLLHLHPPLSTTILSAHL